MKYKREIFEVIHQDAAAHFEIGAISVAAMRECDELCLLWEPEPAQKAADMKQRSPAIG